MSKDLLLDLSFLTEAERDLINNVISKDAQIRKAEQGRISSLRKELDDLKESGLPEEELESKNEKYCARCQTYFGLIFNRGDYCPRCELRVCKVCRVNDIDEGWICTLCDKVRQVKAQSGAWFFQGHKEKNGSLFGSMLVRQSLRRLPGSQSKGIKHEPSNPFIEDEEPSNAFLEDQDVTNPFTSVNHGRSTERLSGQADRNSKESQRNSGHKMGFQYSDESDSEHRSDDESLEDHHDTASDRTRSKDTEVPAMSVHFEQEKTGTSPLDSEHDDAQNSEEEQGEYRDVEVRPNLDVSATNQDTSPEAGDTETIQSANEEDPTSPEGRINAMRAFSEAFVSTSLGLKGSESHEDRDTRKDQDTRVDHGYREGSGPYEDDTISMDRGTREDRGYLEDQGTREDGGYYDSQFDPQRRGYQEEEDPRDDRGYLEDQGTGEDRGYYDSQFDPQKRGYQEEEDPRDDRGYHAESEGPDSRRSSDLHYGGFHADNESMISETSGYGTPSASEDTSSKRTPSISGDEGMSTSRQEARRLPSETAPVIVTTEVDDEGDNDNFRNASITDYDEDLDVSFSKYESGLGNRKLKDQLSLGSRESIVSYYSNAGGEVYGKYPVSGEVLFGIKYDPKIQEFQIQIHQARGITAVDKKSNTSDPYVKTYLLPDRTRTGKRKSKVKKHTINPVFDEILTYKITYDDILQRTLWFAIWNHDSFGHNDFLGEVLVPIDQYHQSGFSLEDPEPQWYDLCERQAEDPQFSYNGEIVFSLKYVPPSALAATKKKKKKKKAGEEKGELHVNIIEASDLMAKDSNGFSDPFCKSYLLPDKSKKTKQKTAVVKKSLNPKWNYHFVYDNVTHEELMDRVLELTVWDFDRGSSNEFLGGVRLGLGTGLKEWDDSNSEEQAAWNKMLNNQNDWNQVRLTLREHMGSHK